jgi:antitoxin component of MazEF toxin-antitoxin module
VVTLPPELLDAMGVSEGDYVLLEATGKELVIRLATPEEVELYPPSDEGTAELT